MIDIDLPDSVLDNRQLDEDVRLAQFKLSLISPVLYGNNPYGSREEYYRHICEETKFWPNGKPFTTKPSTLKKWFYMYQNGGYEALLRSTRSDRGKARGLNDVAISEIEAVRKKHPKVCSTEIHAHLVELGLTEVSARTVQRYTATHKLKPVTRHGDKVRLPFEFAKFGDSWQADTKEVGHITINGVSRKLYCMQIIDDHSRMIVGGGMFLHDNAANFQIAFKRAVAAFGIPRLLMVDNGSPYNNNQLMLICSELGTILAPSQPYDPQYKGKVERLNQTLQTSVIDWLEFDKIKSVEQAQEIYDRFVYDYNHKVHSSTGTTPWNRYEACLDHGLPPRVAESQTWLDRCFMNRILRTVKNDNSIQLSNVKYSVPSGYAGSSVEVRFFPGDMSTAVVMCDGEPVPLVPVDEEANAVSRMPTGQRTPNIPRNAKGTAPRDPDDAPAEQYEPSPYLALADQDGKKEGT